MDRTPIGRRFTDQLAGYIGRVVEATGVSGGDKLCHLGGRRMVRLRRFNNMPDLLACVARANKGSVMFEFSPHEFRPVEVPPSNVKSR